MPCCFRGVSYYFKQKLIDNFFVRVLEYDPVFPQNSFSHASRFVVFDIFIYINGNYDKSCTSNLTFSISLQEKKKKKVT